MKLTAAILLFVLLALPASAAEINNLCSFLGDFNFGPGLEPGG